MNATSGEVLREVLTGLLIQNQTERGVGLEEDAPERRGFQDRADLHLGAMCRLFERERERNKQKSPNHKEYQ